MTPEQTLRERWNEEWEKSANNLIQKELPFTIEMAKTGEYKIFDFFLAQFDEMLAEDIEKIGRMIDECEAEIPVLCEHAFRNAALKQALSILEARRLSLKK